MRSDHGTFLDLSLPWTVGGGLSMGGVFLGLFHASCLSREGFFFGNHAELVNIVSFWGGSPCRASTRAFWHLPAALGYLYQLLGHRKICPVLLRVFRGLVSDPRGRCLVLRGWSVSCKHGFGESVLGELWHDLERFGFFFLLTLGEHGIRGPRAYGVAMCLDSDHGHGYGRTMEHLYVALGLGSMFAQIRMHDMIT